MNIFKRIFSPKEKRAAVVRRPSLRTYLAAEQSRITADWPITGGTADSEIYAALSPLRVRSRHLAKNNDYARRFFNLLKQNVVGPNGVRLQCRAKNERGQLDAADNAYLEKEWTAWGRKGACTMDGLLSFVDVQKLFLETVARDGEAIVRKHIGLHTGNRWNFALEMIEPDRLDHNLNKGLSNGNTVRMGVEVNDYRRPVAYWFKKPSATSPVYGESMDIYDRHVRILADEIIHDYILERVGQSRGVPWLHTAARRLNQLGGYEEAELVAARTAAAKMGFFTNEDGEEWTGDEDDPEDKTEAPIMNAEPGTFSELPAGIGFTPWDPTHPTSAFGAFTLSVLRGAASGLNVSYVSLANDLRGVSYSSIRQGALDERDGWRTLQGWLIEHLLTDVWESWLETGLTIGGLGLPPEKFAKFNTIQWQPRGWAWVDPLKDGKANATDVQNGFKSPQDVAAEHGRDYLDTLDQIKAAKEAAEKAGLSLPIFTNPQQMGAQNATGTQNN